MNLSVQQFRQLTTTDPAATRIRLDRERPDQLVAKANSVPARIGHWFGEVFKSGKARNREAIDAFVNTVRQEQGEAAGDIVARYLSARREAGKPLAPRHIRSGLELTGTPVSGAGSFAEAIGKLGVQEDFRKIGQGGEGVAYEVRVQVGKESIQGVMKTRIGDFALRLRPDASIDGKFARQGESAAAYIGADIPGLIRPDFYIVQHKRSDPPPANQTLDRFQGVTRAIQEKKADSTDQVPLQEGEQAFSVVAGGKTFRNWANERLGAGERPVCLGVIMPKAKGAALMNLDRIEETSRDPALAGRAEPSQLQDAVGASLATLAGMAKHGLRHGDVKPENARYDAQSRTFELFDQGSMVKMSKRNGDAPRLTVAATSLYRDPGFEDDPGAGLEYDLFATGVTLLEASLRERGLHDLAHAVLKEVRAASADPDDASAPNVAMQDLAAILAGDASAPPPADPNPRINLKNRIHWRVDQAIGEHTPAGRQALAMIDAALGQSSPVTARYDPNQPESHPFGALYASAPVGA